MYDDSHLRKKLDGFLREVPRASFGGESLVVDGVFCFTVPEGNPFQNRALVAADDANIGLDTVRRVRNHFASQGKGFTWVIPRPLSEKLRPVIEQEEAKFLFETVGMYVETKKLARLEAVLPENVTIAIVDESSLHDCTTVYATSFGWEPTVSKRILETFNFNRDLDALSILVKERDLAIGLACYAVMPSDGKLAYLGGGAIIPSHQGNGLYRATLVHRARIASARGVEYFLVDAMSHSSAPILIKSGFTEIGRKASFTVSAPNGV